MGSFGSVLGSGIDPQQQLLQQGGVGSLGAGIADIGTMATGTIPGGGTAVPSAASTSPAIPHATGVPSGVTPIGTTAPATSGVPSTVPGALPAGTPTTSTGVTNMPVGDLQSVYGDFTGTAIGQLLSSESGGTAGQVAQQIIQANAPNVAQGAATLNTGLAQSGISPSSSVSAIENANYQAQVQQQNLKTVGETTLAEQQMQQQLLETLLPGQQQRQTDSSGWSIFGDVIQGIGDIFSL